jgi:dienelactone hydrolase
VHRFPFRSATIASCLSLLALASPAVAATDEQLCLIAKHKAVGKHQACLAKTFAAAVTETEPFDSSRCDDSLQQSFASAEDRYGSACRTTGDASALASRGADLIAALETVLQVTGAPAEQLACISRKLQVSGKFASCLEKAETKRLAKNLLRLDDSRCSDKLTAGIAKAATAGACPAGGDADSIDEEIGGIFRDVEADLANLGTADFASAGPYSLTTRTIVFVDSTRSTPANGTYEGAPDRTLVTTVVYPVLPPGVELPLVIRAHGFGGFRFDSGDLINHLASRGMMVVSPDFPLSNLNAPGGPTLADLDEQVVDVQFLISQMLALDQTDGSVFEGKIDDERIGVVGHSLGGATVLGASYHPTLADQRIQAVVALAPLACIFEHEFYAGGTAPLMIVSGTADIVTLPTSNHVAAYANANPDKYFVSLDGGTHTSFANDFLNDDSQNVDDVLACPSLIPEGSPRPVTLDVDIPEDFLGGAAAGVDTTASSCEPICPLPPPTWMTHDRQRETGLAATAAMLEAVFFDSGPADRMLTQRLDAENDDVAVTYDR